MINKLLYAQQHWNQVTTADPDDTDGNLGQIQMWPGLWQNIIAKKHVLGMISSR